MTSPLVTIFLPDTLTGRCCQGALVGACVINTQRDRCSLTVTGCESQLPRSAADHRHVGYIISSRDSGALSAPTAFACLRSYVVLTNDTRPRLIGCAVDGRVVVSSSVVLALYSPLAIASAPLLRASVMDNERVSVAGPLSAAAADSNRAGCQLQTDDGTTWDPIHSMLKHLYNYYDTGTSANTKRNRPLLHTLVNDRFPCSSPLRNRKLLSRATSPVRVRWIWWLLLEMYSLLFVFVSSPTSSQSPISSQSPTSSQSSSSKSPSSPLFESVAHRSSSPGHRCRHDQNQSVSFSGEAHIRAPVSQIRWLLIEAVTALRLRTLHCPLVQPVAHAFEAVASHSATLRQGNLKTALWYQLVGESGAGGGIYWWCEASALFCDGVAGLALFSLLPPLSSVALIEQLSVVMVRAGVRVPLSYMAWLGDSRPAGIKLHVHLSSLLATGSSWVLYATEALLACITWPVLAVLDWITGSESGVLATAGSTIMFSALFLFVTVGGASLMLGVVSDLIALAGIGVLTLHVTMCALIRLTYEWLIRLWRLFRGRRWNAAKRRVETWQFPLEQLVVGTLCFTVLLFLTPTVLAYHVVLLWFRCGHSLTVYLLHLLMHALTVNPLLVLVAWLAQSRRVAGSLHMACVPKAHLADRVIGTANGDGDCLIVRLNVVTASLSKTLAHFRSKLVPPLRRFSISRFLSVLFRGQPVFASDNAALRIRSAFVDYA